MRSPTRSHHKGGFADHTRKFNLLHDGKLNNASAVLFGRDFTSIPSACFGWRVSKELQRRVYRQSAYHWQYLHTAGHCNVVLFQASSLSGKVEGLYREEELEIPYKALRECCTNALCHRSYHRPGSSVGIAIYDDRVEIENSGTFPPDITMESY